MNLEAHAALLTLFADPTRVRLAALLQAAELTVAELTRVTGLSQSRVSTHVGRLRDAQVLCDRKVGVSTFYRVAEDKMPVGTERLWQLVRENVDDTVLASDQSRCAEVVQARTQGSAWPDLVAGRMEYHYSPGRTWEATARGFLGLLRLGDVLDVGSGDGVTAQLLAQRSRSYTCLDRSERVIEAARKRLEHVGNIRFARGDMHDNGLADTSFDQVLMFNVLTYAQQPQRAMQEGLRVLRPGGELVVVTLDEHEHMAVSSAYQHVNEGFSPGRLEGLLKEAGFELGSCLVSSRERRKPYFQVVTAFARRPEQHPKTTASACGA